MTSIQRIQAVPQLLTGARRVGLVLQTLATGILIVCLVSRAFVREHPFRTPPILVPLALSQSQQFGHTANGQPAVSIDPVSREDLSRATYAVALLAACALWLTGGALGGNLRVRHRVLAGLVGIFACCSLISALRAGDGHSATLVWWEQLSMMSAGLLAVQVFADRRRFNLLVCVLAAVAATVAAKGMVQVFLEFPATYADLKQTPELLDNMFGPQEGPTFSRLVDLRLRAMAPTGFFVLSNMLASLLLLAGAAAVGLMIARVADVVRTIAGRRSGKGNRDTSWPIAAAIVSIAVAAIAITVLVMTSSAGAIGAAALAGAAGIVVAAFSKTLLRHWRRAVLIGAATGVAVASATVAYGLSQDRLPTKTMTFRWYYWTASADIVRDEPLLGVGGGNFPDAYLRHRRAEAEEAVKTPHNAVVHAAAQYGLVGGAAYLAVLAYVLVGMCRPGQTEPGSPRPPDKDTALSSGIIGCAAIAAVVVARGVFGGAFVSWPLFIWEAVIPAGVFALALVGVYSGSRKVAQQTTVRFGRIALACGAAAFVVHNMVSFSLWAPGPATMFWVVGGALLAGAGGQDRSIARARWPMAAAAWVAVAAVAVLLWQPIWSQTARWDQVNRSLQAGKRQAALSASKAASQVRDDAMSTAEAARLRAEFARLAEPSASKAVPEVRDDELSAAERLEDRLELLQEAMTLADLASEQLPSRASFHNMASSMAWSYASLAGDSDAQEAALDHAQQAVELDPMNMQSRLNYAKMLNGAGLREQMLGQLSEIEEIDSRLAAESVYRLSLAQRKSISQLRAGSGEP